MRKPPRIATWMLEHCHSVMSGGEQLAGDMYEGFQAGRSRLWFWRQLLTALSLGCTNELIRRRGAFAFAVVWSFFTPLSRALFYGSYFGQRYCRAGAQLAWPWSAAASVAILYSVMLSFVLAGFLLSSLAQRGNSEQPTLRHIGRSVAWASVLCLVGMPPVQRTGPSLVDAAFVAWCLPSSNACRLPHQFSGDVRRYSRSYLFICRHCRCVSDRPLCGRKRTVLVDLCRPCHDALRRNGAL